MPSPEALPAPSAEGEPDIPAYRAAVFENELAAEEVYFQARDALRDDGHTFSVFAFGLDEEWCVAVLNRLPRAELDVAAQQLLSGGRPITLPPEELAFLQLDTSLLNLEGRVKNLPWVERDRRSPGPSPTS